MNATDISRAVGWMEARWGHQTSWKNWDDLWVDFAPYTPGALMQALNEWYRAGEKFAPKPSELLRRVGEVQRYRVERGEDPPFDAPCETHVWSMPLPWEDDRHLLCVRCDAEGPLESHDHLPGRNGSCVYCPKVVA